MSSHSSMVLASRFRKPIPIFFGILAATLANHALAGFAGQFVGERLGGPVLRWVLGLSFLAMAVWTLVPDKLDESDAVPLTAVGKIDRKALRSRLPSRA